MRILLFLIGAIVLSTGFLFLSSKEGLETITRVMQKPVGGSLFRKIEEFLNRKIEVDDFVIKYRRQFAMLNFFVGILLIFISLYSI